MLPDPDLSIYGPQRISAVVKVLMQDGIPPEKVLEGSGVGVDQLNAANTRVSYGQVSAVFRNAMRLAVDPATALRAGRHMRLTAYGMYGYALLCCPNPKELVNFGTSYQKTMGSIVLIDYEETHDGGVYRYQPLLSSDIRDELYRFTIEFSLSAHLTVCRDVYGGALILSLCLWCMLSRFMPRSMAGCSIAGLNLVGPRTRGGSGRPGVLRHRRSQIR